MFLDAETIDTARRARLCNREHAGRIAQRLCQSTLRPIAVVRTGSPLQPFRVTDDPDSGEGEIEMEVVVL